MIKEKGRTENEDAIVFVNNGIYKGFGYFEKNDDSLLISDYENCIELKQDNSDVQRILKGYLNDSTKENIFYETVLIR